MKKTPFRDWMVRRGFRPLSPDVLPDELKDKGGFAAPVWGELREKAADDSGDETELRLPVRMTTSKTDRDGDIVESSGCQMTWFEKNPVLLWNHDYYAVPIGNVDVATIKVKKTYIDADVLLDPEDEFAVFVHGKYERGIMRAWSIGFVPLEYEEITDKDTGKWLGWHITKWELVELSAVPVPANPEALTRELEEIEAKGATDERMLAFAKAIRATKEPETLTFRAGGDGDDTIGVVDHPDMKIADGAFSKSIAERVAAGKVATIFHRSADKAGAVDLKFQPIKTDGDKVTEAKLLEIEIHIPASKDGTLDPESRADADDDGTAGEPQTHSIEAVLADAETKCLDADMRIAELV